MSVIDMLEQRRKRQSRETPVDEQCLRQSLVHELRQLRFWSQIHSALLIVLILRMLVG